MVTRPESEGMSASRLSTREYTSRVLIAAGIAALLFLLWQVVDVVVLIFGGILFAAVLRALTDPLVRATRLPDGVALAVVVLALVALVVLAGWLFGARMSGQLEALVGTVRDTWGQVRSWLQESQTGAAVLEAAQSARGSVGAGVARVARAASTAAGGIAHAVLILFIGLFLAASPALYRRGLVALAPPDAQRGFGDALDASGHALKKWLLGQLVAMIAVGLLTGIGLWALGIPLAFSLALIAALLEFVPYVGPIVASIPAILVGLSQGPTEALWVAGLFFVIQQIESYVISPLAQKWAVELPPALALVAVVVFGLLFGVLGILLATPLMVIVMVLVQELYIKRALHEPEGEASGSS